MHIKKLLLCLLFFPTMLFASGEHSGTFYSFTLESATGNSRDGNILDWHFSSWIGNDENKFYLKSKGEYTNDNNKDYEILALYSKNIDDFWDAQFGIKHDDQNINHATIGAQGMMPYFIETEIYGFISEEGDFSAQLSQERDILMTQKFITKPYYELNLSFNEVKEQDIGRGFTNAEIGLRTRYEISREFSPYIDLKFQTNLGETANISNTNPETVLLAGVRIRM